MFANVKLSKRDKNRSIRVAISAILLIIAAFVDFGGTFNLILFFASYLIAGYDILLKSVYNIKNGQIFDENFLMSIATIGALALGEYAESVFVMVFYQVGQIFESIAVGQSRDSIQALIDYSPEYANVIRDGEVEVVEPDEIEVGEIVLVKVGEKIPVDGEIVEGSTALDMAFLTGESIPVDVEVGDTVHSGSINQSAVIKVKTNVEFEDSTMSKILELIEDSSDKKSEMEGFITRFARVYTPIVVFLALALAILPPIILNQPFEKWIPRALNFLVVSCPCALVISVPLAFFAGIGSASKKAILVKGSNYLEALAACDTIVFDKTGTITKGNFEIVEEVSFTELPWQKYAAGIEKFSNHPIASAITSKYDDENILISNVEELKGMGLVGESDEMKIAAGNEKLMNHLGIEVKENTKIGTLVYIAIDGKLAAEILIADTIKEDSADALFNIKKEGIKKLVLLTGDRREAAMEIAKDLEIDEVHAELLPEDKVSEFENIMENTSGKVAYVGDGINDAPVIRRADIGIAMGALGSDAAIESADIVLMDDKLSKIPTAIKIANKTVSIVRQNVSFAIGVKLLALLLSAIGIASMWMAIFADVGVMVIAVLNSTRAMN